MTGQPNAVLFDMGGVLFRYAPERRQRYLSEVTGLPESEVQARVFDRDFDEACETGALDAAQSCATFNRLCGTELSPEALRRALTSGYEADGILIGIVRELSRSCLLAGLTNNGFVVRDGLLELHPDLPAIFADRLYCSAEIGVRKPDTKAFQAVLDRIGRAAEDVLFVDDSETNLRAAHAMGFHVHRFFDAEFLETDLRSFGLL